MLGSKFHNSITHFLKYQNLDTLDETMTKFNIT